MKLKIMKMWVERSDDPDPDLSYLGEYSDRQAEYGIDRKKLGDWQECEYRYWNPCNHVPPGEARNWHHVTTEQIMDTLERAGLPAAQDRASATVALDRHYKMQDYRRHEAANRGDWSCIGIQAFAEVQAGNGSIQNIHSGGLWGIESDSEADYLESVEAEELSQLADELKSWGFDPADVQAALAACRAAT